MTARPDGVALRLWFTVAVILTILATTLLILAPVRGAIAWAAFLAFLLLPLQRRLTRRFGNRPNAAAGVLTGLAPFVLLVPLALLGMAFAQQVSSLVGPLQSGGNLMDLRFLQDHANHPRRSGRSGLPPSPSSRRSALRHRRYRCAAPRGRCGSDAVPSR